MIEKKYGKGMLRPYSCLPGTYGKMQVNTEPTSCIAFDLVIATRANMSDDLVYDFTKALFENLPQFFTRLPGKDAKLITLADAMKNVNIPFHPGALKYYREKGLIK